MIEISSDTDREREEDGEDDEDEEEEVEEENEEEEVEEEEDLEESEDEEPEFPDGVCGMECGNGCECEWESDPYAEEVDSDYERRYRNQRLLGATDSALDSLLESYHPRLLFP